MSLELYLAYFAACLVITLVPGPTVALIIANGLTHGTRPALATGRCKRSCHGWR